MADLTTGKLPKALGPTTIGDSVFSEASGAGSVAGLLHTFGDLVLHGSTSGTVSLRPPAAAGASIITFPVGTTNFTATGGAGQVLQQATLGGPITVGAVPGLGAGVATWLATPTSANLKAAVTDETGTGGALVFATAPSISAPTITGTVNAGGGTLASGGAVQVSMAQPNLYLNATGVDTTATTTYQAAGVDRWILGKHNQTETGGNAGSMFFLQRCSDVGGFVGYPLMVNRADGFVGLSVGGGSNIPQSRLHIGAAGASPGTARIYNTYTDASNGEWAWLGDWSGNVSRFGTSMNGTGASRDVAFFAGGIETMRIDASRRILIGSAQSYPAGGFARNVQIYAPAGVQIGRHSADAFAPGISFTKSRNATVGSHTAVVAEDQLMQLSATGSDGTDYRNSSQIFSYVDGAVFAGVVPGRLSFWTTNSGGTHAERMRITSAGNVVCNSAGLAPAATDGFLYIPGGAGPPTGVPTAFTGRVALYVDTTNHKFYFYSGAVWRDAGP